MTTFSGLKKQKKPALELLSKKILKRLIEKYKKSM